MNRDSVPMAGLADLSGGRGRHRRSLLSREVNGLMGVVRRVAVVATCVPVLVLAGCGDDESAGEPVELPSLSPSAASLPSMSESVEVEDLPADEVEPEEFVRAWVDAYNHAALTGDASRIRALSLDACVTCTGFAEAYEGAYSAGGGVTIDDGALPAEVSALSNATEAGGFTRVEASLKFNAGKSSEGDAEPTAYPASEDDWVFYLVLVDGQWRVSDVGV
ncbi:DUF6318 family protein [Nocardioides sp. AE5]|uniref:DUF6318 family protein n=1 Tax=Nocardioides sp. AE5 TaxID=2962573 RepID=UPI002881C120|nr:DUF6318 family protein [Nocardioides sp. AE5]MDT0203272.1 DUF6318 family protein [Nocardioides sp. AE5]